ncbi:hypothetical protein [Dysgonomonas sp. 520]|uniref:hypothetical protein n=1 Tax=Dysgonomonas sp. 520 TaxID=2302931 RepID=UPI0013D4A605|nr:hypothetical protein [Dysgonomonas sp. 520]NDW11011.1 hypothetical protein [Dysgonomonas sp. 520]
MRKIKWINLIVALGCVYIIVAIIFWDTPETYERFAQRPSGQGSGTTGSRLFYFLIYKIDQWIGKTGVIVFFSLSFLFLFSFFL